MERRIWLLDGMVSRDGRDTFATVRTFGFALRLWRTGRKRRDDRDDQYIFAIFRSGRLRRAIGWLSMHWLGTVNTGRCRRQGITNFSGNGRRCLRRRRLWS
jgi:hypothetical protein